MKKRILTLLLILLLPNLSFAAAYVVVGVLDGDTIKVMDPDGHKISVRLYGIDCPETAKRGKAGQAYGNVAKKRINELIRKEYVDLETYGSDRYGRTIAVV